MARGRSKSVVERIAVDVPSGDLDEAAGPLAGLPAAPAPAPAARPRSASMPAHAAADTTVDTTVDPAATACAADTPLLPRELLRLFAPPTPIVIPPTAIDAIDADANGAALTFQLQCLLNRAALHTVAADTAAVIARLARLQLTFDAVGAETRDFAAQLLQLIGRQERLTLTLSDIDSHLGVFELLDAITRQLINTPGVNIVRKTLFLATLRRLDACLAFVEAHPHFKELEVYKIRFRQCMTRSLTLVRNYLVDDLKELQRGVTARLVAELRKSGGGGDTRSLEGGGNEGGGGEGGGGDGNEGSLGGVKVTFELFLYTAFRAHAEPAEVLDDGGGGGGAAAASATTVEPTAESSAAASSAAAGSARSSIAAAGSARSSIAAAAGGFVSGASGASGGSFSLLAGEIRRRADAHPEYLGLYDEVLSQYFRVRSGLLNDYVWAQLDAAVAADAADAAAAASPVQFFQNNISFFRTLVTREIEMHAHYFGREPAPLAPLVDWLKTLLEPLYDTLRNKTIRETNIGTLCEITTLLQKYYEFEDAGGVPWGELFEPVLHDVQARLIFRIQLYVDDKLVRYRGGPEDLRVGGRRPNKELPRESPPPEDPKQESPPLEDPNQASKGSVAPSSVAPTGSVAPNGSVGGPGGTGPSGGPDASSLDYELRDNLFPSWFPPIGKALTILSSIYELVNLVVFDDLAHYIVHSCIFILKNTAYRVALLHLGEGDAKLYLLKNLVLLQQQVNTFDIQYVRTETSVDFTGGLVAMLRDRGGRGLGALVPRVVNNMIDARGEIERELAATLGEFVELCVRRMAAPLGGADGAAAWAFRDKVALELPRVKREVAASFGSAQVTAYVVDAVVEALLAEYERFAEAATGEVMEVDTLYGFLSEIVNSEE
jgi:uncharacterized membrane protein YgcG